MERDERVWKVVGGPEEAFIFDGPYIPYSEEITVVPQSELQRVQGLLDTIKPVLELCDSWFNTPEIPHKIQMGDARPLDIGSAVRDALEKLK